MRNELEVRNEINGIDSTYQADQNLLASSLEQDSFGGQEAALGTPLIVSEEASPSEQAVTTSDDLINLMRARRYDEILEMKFSNFENIIRKRTDSYTLLNYIIGQHSFFFSLYVKVRLLKKFLAAGANPHAVDEKNSTLLHSIAVCNSDYLDLAQILLDYKVNINVANDEGITPLTLAVATHANTFDHKMIDWFLAHGANVDGRDENGKLPPNGNTPLQRVVHVMNVMMVSKMQRCFFGNSISAIGELLKAGADVTIKNDQGITLVMWAAGHIFYNEGKYFIEKYKDMSERSKDIYHKNQSRLMEVLLMHGGAETVLEVNKAGKTAVDIAKESKSENVETVLGLAVEVANWNQELNSNRRSGFFPHDLVVEYAKRNFQEELRKEILKRDLKFFFDKKQLPEDSYEAFVNPMIKLEDSIETHAAWLYEKILCHSYPLSRHEIIRKARDHHGADHSASVAAYITVGINLLRSLDDERALALTPKMHKLSQLSGLFHDVGREGDGRDEWEHDSGLIFYSYLVLTLNVEEDLAKVFAAVIVNKDREPGQYEELSINSCQEYVWTKAAASQKMIISMEIFQLLIEVLRLADMLEVKRARGSWDGRRSNFYKSRVLKTLSSENSSDYSHDLEDTRLLAELNEPALRLLSGLRVETRSILERMGRDYHWSDPTLRNTFDCREAYEKITALFYNLENGYHLLPLLHAHNQLITVKDLKQPLLIQRNYDESKEITVEKVMAAIHGINGHRAYFRGVSAPSAEAKKAPKPGKKRRTLAEIELDKTFRRKTKATETRKSNKFKHGNPCRSVSMMGPGSVVFTNVGFLILDEDVSNISHISSVDDGTGRNKKKMAKMLEYKLSPEQKKIKLEKLKVKQLLGGDHVFFRSPNNYPSEHNEITMDIDHFDAIVCTPDHCLYNQDASRLAYNGAKPSPYPVHRNAHLLQADYLERLYRRKIAEYQQDSKEVFKPSLEIFEVSGVHDKVTRIGRFSDEAAVHLWVTMCEDFVAKALEQVDSNEILVMSIEDIKILSMYGTKENHYALQNASADVLYEEKLQFRINEGIKAARERSIAAYIKKAEKEISLKWKGNCSILFIDDIFFNLLRFPDLQKRFHQEIVNELKLHDLQGEFKYTDNFRRKFYFHEEDEVAYSKKSLLSLKQKDVSLRRNNALRSKLYGIPIVRLYELEKCLGDEKCFTLIKPIVTKGVKNVTASCLSSRKDLIELNNMIAAFDLYDQYKEFIAHKVDCVYRNSSENMLEDKLRDSFRYSRPDTFLNYVITVWTIHSLGFLDENYQQMARSDIVELIKYVVSTPSNDQREAAQRIIEHYLFVATLIKTPFEEQKAAVIQLLGVDKVRLNQAIVTNLLYDDKAGLNLLQDAEVFKLFITKTKSENNPGDTCRHVFAFFDYNPDIIADPERLKFIKDHFDHCVSEWLEKEKKDEDLDLTRERERSEIYADVICYYGEFGFMPEELIQRAIPFFRRELSLNAKRSLMEFKVRTGRDIIKEMQAPILDMASQPVAVSSATTEEKNDLSLSATADTTKKVVPYIAPQMIWTSSVPATAQNEGLIRSVSAQTENGVVIKV